MHLDTEDLQWQTHCQNHSYTVRKRIKEVEISQLEGVGEKCSQTDPAPLKQGGYLKESVPTCELLSGCFHLVALLVYCVHMKSNAKLNSIVLKGG